MNELNNNKLLSIASEDNLACIVVFVVIMVSFAAFKLKRREISLSYQKANDIEYTINILSEIPEELISCYFFS